MADDRLSELTLTDWAPEVGNANVQQQASNIWQIQFTAAAGQVFQTTQQLAQLSFLAVSNSSAFVPLWVDDITNSQVNGLLPLGAKTRVRTEDKPSGVFWEGMHRAV